MKPLETSPLRVLGVAMEPVADFRRGPVSRNAGVFAALDRRLDLVGTVRPQPGRVDFYRSALLNFHRDRDAWRTRAYLHPSTFERRSRILTEALEGWRGRYDLIFELQSLFAPRPPDGPKPYTIYTDSTFSLTRRSYPAWVPLRPRAARRIAELEAETCRGASTVFAKSHFLRDALIDDYGCEPERVVVVGGGTNSLADSLERRSYGSQVVLFLGIAFERKGGQVVLDAWKRVRERVPDAELWIAGPRAPQGPEGDGVRWLGYVGGRDKLGELFERADLFVMPSVFEPYGLVFLEAMGHGLACVGADVCAMPEIIRDGETGRLVPPGESEPLADAMVELLSDPARLEAMGRRAYDQVRGSMTWEHVADRMLPHILAAGATATPGRRFERAADRDRSTAQSHAAGLSDSAAR